MKHRLTSYGENLLFALNILIVFVLIFNDKLVIAPWLHAFGRMHPLVLHFPIVILLLAIMVEIFRLRPLNRANQLYRSVVSNLLLIGTILAAVTVLMGLFLSKEEGYEGNILFWHKWLGVAVVFTSSISYWMRASSFYKSVIARVFALLIAALLVCTGHFGAVLTHGDNFILAPLMVEKAAAKVPLEDAVVFKDIVQPIFQSKCQSCHGLDKRKGGLDLADSNAIKKGGKTGDFMVPYKPELSLLYKRINLPADDKLHMSPAGKPQLTEKELMLIKQWVKSGGNFNKKVISYPATDSLRIIASTFLEKTVNEEAYDFVEANPKDILKLNNAYRVITPLAKGSPALNVDVFNRTSYSSKVIKDLNALKTQIISINLNKLPVSDEDLSEIAKFENLRSLHLNFTNISGRGLTHLTPLKNLQNLSLAGTKVNYDDLKKLAAVKSLKELTIWNTLATDNDVKRLKSILKKVTINIGFKDDGKNMLRLNAPILENKTSVFNKPVQLRLTHAVKNVQIRYTIDNSMPDSLHSLLYNDKLFISKNSLIKVKAFKKGWSGSPVISLGFYKSEFNPDSVALFSPLYEGNKGSGVSTLFDHIVGDGNIFSNKWVGTTVNDMIIGTWFKKPVKISSISFNCRVQQGNAIFGPIRVEVWAGTPNGKYHLIKAFKPNIDQTKSGIEFMEFNFSKTEVSHLKVIIRPLADLPKASKKVEFSDVHPILLIDELMLN